MSVRLDLTNSSSLFQESSKREHPYPGLSAVFVWKCGNWDNPFDSGADLCREITFESIRKGSLLTQFSLFGYTNGSIALRVEFSAESSFKKYLVAHQISDYSRVPFNCLCSENDDIKKLFSIIGQNNTFPAERFAEIYEIVERGACDPFDRPSRDNRVTHTFYSECDGECY